MKMHRVINLDMTCYCEDGEKDIILECETIEEAKQCETDHYYFNTSVEQLVDGEWVEVLMNGMTDEQWKEFGEATDRAWNTLFNK
jgi:hypothetical protein